MCLISITIGCTATGFPPLRGSKPAREPGVRAQSRKYSVDARSQFEAKQAFVLTESHIRKIWKVFTDAGLNVKASAKCSDEIIRNFESCESLLSYENTKRAALVNLDIQAIDPNSRSISEVSFGEKFSAPIRVSISGEEQYVINTRAKIADIIDSSKAWYSWIAVFDLFYFWMPLIVLGSTLFNLTTKTSGSVEKGLPLKTALLALLVISSVIGAFAFIVWLTSFMRKKFFPISTFSLGQGNERNKHSEQMRWVVIVGFVISIVSSTLTTLIIAP